MSVRRLPPEKEFRKGQTQDEMRAQFQERIKGSFNDLVGLELVEARAGYARFRLPVRPEILQVFRVVHGGAIATLADVAGGIATRMSVPEGTLFVTSEMKINYFSPVSEGELYAEAKPLHLGRRTSVWEVRVTDGGGKRVAFVTATYMVVEEPPPEGG